ncbi:heme utilization cystosolic carrier protein HutX [Pseudovibrio exalbescens]|uniref:heme utilization cystosolic carrier protein HutX n=1 Tax=Pseudovibrio exalbescens TaxID=197461 RepID=UPI002365954E|nr:heme utilization cystosolic carrier protein HutX [Pseudovibrio exalbescens]MDD7909804.1 heme utilization cystosolic carrier protein HutX [Pseudovibrio exalbescens]
MTTVLDQLKKQLAENPAGILENIAKEHQVSVADTIRCLPEDMWRELDGSHFEQIIKEIPEWGAVTTIANTGDMIFEVSGVFPRGTFARGYYNLKKTEGGFSGHIKEDACHAILFLKRPFFSKLSASINFINADGDCYLKIFLGRDEEGKLRADQLEKFHALSDWA